MNDDDARGKSVVHRKGQARARTRSTSNVRRTCTTSNNTASRSLDGSTSTPPCALRVAGCRDEKVARGGKRRATRNENSSERRGQAEHGPSWQVSTDVHSPQFWCATTLQRRQVHVNMYISIHRLCYRTYDVRRIRRTHHYPDVRRRMAAPSATVGRRTSSLFCAPFQWFLLLEGDAPADVTSGTGDRFLHDLEACLFGPALAPFQASPALLQSR